MFSAEILVSVYSIGLVLLDLDLDLELEVTRTGVNTKPSLGVGLLSLL